MEVETGNRAARPIGVFDSGLGGLTVVRQLQRLMPGEDVVYLGDSARVPYGIKSPRTVREFALQDAAFLRRFDPKMIVVACNTASAVALDALQKASPIEVVGVVAPAAAEAVRLANGKTIGVIGTEGTINSKAYQRAIHALDATCRVVAAAAPLLVPIVEEGRAEDDPIVLHVLGDYLHYLQRARPAVLILGCTHYPLLGKVVYKLMGPETQLLDPGEATAAVVKAYLEGKGWLSTNPSGALRCFSTDNARRFGRLAGRFLGRVVREVGLVGTDELAEGGEGLEA
jgi:glutamate racemase